MTILRPTSWLPMISGSILVTPSWAPLNTTQSARSGSSGMSTCVARWGGSCYICYNVILTIFIITSTIIRWTLAAVSTALTPSSCRWWLATTRIWIRDGASVPRASSDTTTPGCVWTWARVSRVRRWRWSSVMDHQDKFGPLTFTTLARMRGGRLWRTKS